MKRLIFQIFIFIVTFSRILGQDVNVTAKFDSSAIYIGDQIKFTVSVDKPAGINVSIPLLKDTLCKNIEILSGPVYDTVKGADGRIKILSRYLVTSFDSGFYQIPPQFAEIKNEAGLKRFYSDYSQLKVMRVRIAPADTTLKIFDIIKPYRAPVTLGEIIPWALVAIISAALIWFIIHYIRNHKKKKSGEEPLANPDPAHIIAFRELELLKSKELWQKGELKKYYSELTEILRKYLENRYSVYSLEMTTMETLEALLKTGFKKDAIYNQIKVVLTAADLVKFAKHLPEPEENNTHFDNAWDFIEKTKPAEVISGISEQQSKNMEDNL
jgi:hypothetical protein